jgi:hypothetical protein
MDDVADRRRKEDDAQRELRGVASRSSPMSPVEGVDRKDGKISGALIADD